MRLRARTRVPIIALALALALQPAGAGAITRWVPPAPRPAVALPAPVTVDHPPVDGVTSFDNGPRNSGKVALTFDADMTPAMLQQLRSGQVHSWYNQEVRDILDSERVPATIFLTGLWAQTYPAIARSLAGDPLFEIGSHTHDHAAFRTPCYSLVPAGDRVAEITMAGREIEEATGLRPSLLRFPGDCWDRSDAALAASLGMTVISGDVRGGDAFNTSATAISNTVLRGIQPGSIVLLHMQGGPNAPMTAPALRTIIDGIRQRGLGFATVSELLQRTPARVAAVRTSSEILLPLRAGLLGAPAGNPQATLRLVRGRALRRPATAWSLLERLIP